MASRQAFHCLLGPFTVFQVSLCWLVLIALTFSFPCQALILNAPSPPTGFSAILTNGSMDVTWTTQPGDPKTFGLEVLNNVTLDTFNLAFNIDASVQKLTVAVPPDMPGSPHYYLQALNGPGFLAQTGEFTVAGAEPETTLSVSETSTTNTGATSSFVQTTASQSPSIAGETASSAASSTISAGGGTIQSIASPTPSPSTAVGSASAPSKGPPTGAIVGGTVGGTILLAIILALLCIYRRRRIRRRTADFVIEEYKPEASNSAHSPDSADAPAGTIFPAPVSRSSGGVPAAITASPRKGSSRFNSASNSTPSNTSSYGSSVPPTSANTSANTSSPLIPPASAPEELQSRLALMAERVRQLETERELWGEQPPDYVSAAGDREPV